MKGIEKFGIGVAIVLIVIALLAVTGQKGTPPGGTQGQVAIALTDPLQMPNGTQALVVGYSSLQAHLKNSGASGWIESSSNGTVDLLSLQNISQTLGIVNVPYGASIDAVRFNVTSLTIRIGGAEYNITPTSRTLSASLSAPASPDNSSSIVVSLSPAIVEVMGANSTYFAMVPSLRAVTLAQGSNRSSLTTGYRFELGTRARNMLTLMLQNVSIANASLYVSGDNTRFAVTVRNNGNSTALLRHISLQGNLSSSVNLSTVSNVTLRLEETIRDRIRNGTACQGIPNATGANSTINARAGPNGTSAGNPGQGGQGGQAGEPNNSDFGNVGEQLQSRYNVQINASICTAPGFMEFQNEVRSRVMNFSSGIGLQREEFKLVSFLALQNGTLSLPYDITDVNSTGYVLGPGESETLLFNGTIVSASGSVLLAPVIGHSYVVGIGSFKLPYSTVNAMAQ